MASSLGTEKQWHLFVFAGLSSCCAELLTTPIDCVKTRLQLDRSRLQRSSFTRGLNLFLRIVRVEGVLALYAGVQPALLRQATYGALRIGLYEHIKGLPGVDSSSFLSKIMAGMASGALASALCTPTDVVKVRLQAGDSASVGGSRNVFRALAHIGANEGLRGLYRGLVPTMQRASVVAAAEIATYDEFKAAIVLRGADPALVSTHFAAAIFAGGVCSIASTPIDVVKSRVMAASREDAASSPASRSSTAVFLRALREEGPRALWKGGLADFARRGPHCVVNYLVLEQLRSYFAAAPTSPDN